MLACDFGTRDCRADSTASKRISLSIPFSRPICSMTLISSRFHEIRNLPGILRLAGARTSASSRAFVTSARPSSTLSPSRSSTNRSA